MLLSSRSCNPHQRRDRNVSTNHRHLSNLVYSAGTFGTRRRDDCPRLAKSSRHFQWTGFHDVHLRQHALRFHAAYMVLARCGCVFRVCRRNTRRTRFSDAGGRVFHRVRDGNGDCGCALAGRLLRCESRLRVSAGFAGDGHRLADLGRRASFSRSSVERGPHRGPPRRPQISSIEK